MVLMKQATLSAAIIIAVLSVFAFGVMTMNMSDDGSMSACLFIDQGMVMCPMSLAQHIGIVQGIFNVIPKNMISIISPYILLAILALFSINKLGIDFNESRRYFYTIPPPSLSFNKILLALSDGKLQPKLYA